MSISKTIKDLKSLGIDKVRKYPNWAAVTLTPAQMGVCNFFVNGVPYNCDGIEFSSNLDAWNKNSYHVPAPTGNWLTDQTNLQAAFDKVLTQGPTAVILSKGTYKARNLVFRNGLEIIGPYPGSQGFGAYQTDTTYPANFVSAVIQQDAAATGHFVTFDGFHEYNGADRKNRIGPFYCKNIAFIGNASATGSSDGIRLQNVDDVGAANNGSATTAAITQHSVVFEDCIVRNFSGNGWWIPSGSGFITFKRCIAEFNKGYGYYSDLNFTCQMTTSFDHCSSEGNLTGDWYVDGAGITTAFSGHNGTNIEWRNCMWEQRYNSAYSANGATKPIILNNCNQGVFRINGGYSQSTMDTIAPGHLVTIQGNSAGYYPTVIIDGHKIQQFANLHQDAATVYLINDTVNSFTIPSNVSRVTYGKNTSDNLAASDYFCGTAPQRTVIETDQTSNQHVWRDKYEGGKLQRIGVNDSGYEQVFEEIIRNGTQVQNHNFKRMTPTLGTSLSSGDFSLSGWGTGASIAFIGACRDQRYHIRITAGASPTANPTYTHTYKDGTFDVAPVPVGNCYDSANSLVYGFSCNRSATTCAITLIGTPVAGRVYDFLIVML